MGAPRASTHRVRAVGVGCALVLSCPAACDIPQTLTPPNIDSACTVQADGTVECSFTNTGGPGAACVRPILCRRDGSAQARSMISMCSGQLGPQSSSTARGILESPPGDVCGQLFGQILWSECDVLVGPENGPLARRCEPAPTPTPTQPAAPAPPASVTPTTPLAPAPLTPIPAHRDVAR